MIFCWHKWSDEDKRTKMFMKALQKNSRDYPFTTYSDICNYCGYRLKLYDGPYIKCPVCKKSDFQELTL